MTSGYAAKKSVNMRKESRGIVFNWLLSRSSLEPLISLDLVGTKLYCFRARVHCYHCFYILSSTNHVRRSEELRGDPHLGDTFMSFLQQGAEVGKEGLALSVSYFCYFSVVKFELCSSSGFIFQSAFY